MLLRQLPIGVLIVLWPAVQSAEAQFHLRSADGKTGLLAADGVSLLNYDVAESRIGVSLNYDRSRSDVEGRQLVLGPLTEVHFEAGFSASKGKRDLFKGGGFTPGYDVGVTVSHSRERSGAGYHQVFVRARIDQTARKTFVLPSDGAVTLGDEIGSVLALGGGYNFSPDEAVVWGLSASAAHHWNSTEGLKERTVCIDESAGLNGEGAMVRVSTCTERFAGPLRDLWNGQIRSDLSIHLGTLDGLKAAGFGILASVSATLTEDLSTTYNLAAGFVLFRPEHPRQVLLALLLEGTDIGNRRGTSPALSDQLSFRAYVGVPFSLLK